MATVEETVVAPLVTLETQPNGSILFKGPDAAVRSFLSKTAKSVCPVAAVGDMRMGKSTLMNILLRMAANKSNINLQIGKKGFRTGATTKAVTKGVWIALHAVPLEESSVMLILDTEGLNSTDVNQEYDIKLFGFVIAITRMIIFNMMKKMQSSDINVLALSGEASKKMMSHSRSAKSSGGGETPKKRRRQADRTGPQTEEADPFDDEAPSESVDTVMSGEDDSPGSMPGERREGDTFEEMNQKEFGKIAPHLMVLIRDSLELDHPHMEKKNLGSEEYLEAHLDPAPLKYPLEKKKRECIRNIFPERTCYTFPRPTDDPEIEKNVSAVPDSQLKKDFVASKNQFVALLSRILSPKMIMGRELDGPGFLNLIDSLVETMNNNTDLIAIQDVFAASAQLTCQNLYNDLLRKWEVDVEESFQHQQRALNTSGSNVKDKYKGIQDPEILNKRLTRFIGEYMAQYRKRAAETAFADEIATKLETELSRRKDNILQMNQTILRSYLQSYAFKIQSTIQTECKTFCQFKEKFDDMKKQIEDNVSPVALKLLFQEFLSPEVLLQMIEGLLERESQDTERQSKLLKTLTEEHEIIRNKYAKQQGLLEEKDGVIEKMKEDFIALEESLGEEVKKLEHEKNEMTSQKSDHVDSLMLELENLRHRIGVLDSELMDKIESHSMEASERDKLVFSLQTRVKELENAQMDAGATAELLREKADLLLEQEQLAQSYKFQLEATTSRIETKERELESQKHVMNDLRTNLEKQANALQMSGTIIDQAENERDALVAKLHSADEQKSSLSRDFTNQIQELRENVEKLQNQLVKSVEKIRDLDAQNMKQKEELKESHRTNKELNNDHLVELKKAYDEVKQQSLLNAQAKNQSDREKNDIERKHAQEMKKLELEINALKSANTAYQNSNSVASDEMRKSKDEMNGLRSEISRLRTTMSRDASELSVLRTQKQSKDQDLTKLQNSLQELTREHENLKGSFETKLMEAKMQGRGLSGTSFTSRLASSTTNLMPTSASS